MEMLIMILFSNMKNILIWMERVLWFSEIKYGLWEELMTQGRYELSYSETYKNCSLTSMENSDEQFSWMQAT